MTEVTKILNDYAERVGKLRSDLLFDEVEALRRFDQSAGMAVQFFLAAIAQMDMAERMIRLAALQWKQEQE